MTKETELEVEHQLKEYEEALKGIDEALRHDPGSEELTEVKQSLLAAVAELNAALLEVKRSRLLASLEGQAQAHAPPPTETLPPLEPLIPLSSTTPEDAHDGQGTSAAVLGAPCRFRYMDGRWYRGRVTSIEAESGMAFVHFDFPTRSYMLSGARVQLSGLRPPRGQSSITNTPAPVPTSSPTQGPGTSKSSSMGGTDRAIPEAGARVFVRPQACQQQLWQGASVVSVSGTEAVVLYDQGGRSRVHLRDLVSEAWEGCSDLESDSGSEDMLEEEEEDEGDDSSGAEDADDVEEGTQGLGSAAASGYGRHSRKRLKLGGPEAEGEQQGSVLGHVKEAAAAGALTDTKHFAQWEKHGRGVASRLMAKSGYVQGTGLGRQGSGIVQPVQALVLPKKQGLGLGSAGRSVEGGEGDEAGPEGGPLKRKRRAGGERKRRAKHAAASREAKDAKHRAEDERYARGGAPGLFGFLNQALGDNSASAAKVKEHEQSMFRHDSSEGRIPGGAGGSSSVRPSSSDRQPGRGASSGAAGGPDARARLMKQQGRVEHCNARVAHFQDMLQRNRSNASLAAQIMHRLKEVQKELASELAEQARMSKSIKGKDDERKMMKF